MALLAHHHELAVEPGLARGLRGPQPGKRRANDDQPGYHSEISLLKGDSYRLRGKDLDTRIGAKPAEIG